MAFVCCDDTLLTESEKIALVIPLGQLLRRNAERLAGMTPLGFSERDVEVVVPRHASVVISESTQHVAVTLRSQDAFGDDVIAGIEGVADISVDKADVGKAGLVMFSKDGPAEIVLLDPRDSPAEPGSQSSRDGGLSGC